MLREEQIRLLKGLIHYQESGTNVDAGGIIQNPSSTYTCEERFEKEWNTFFKNHPQIVGMTGDLPEPQELFLPEKTSVCLYWLLEMKKEISEHLQMSVLTEE